MEALILVLLALVILSGSAAGLLAFRAKAQGLRLLVVAPGPAALVVGVFGVAYFVSYASNHGATALFVSLLVLAAWIIGFVLCSIAVFLAKWF
ncbi:MAG TPA: hypothetical protein VFZ81_07915 [Burkholderiales bacterium]